MKHRSLTSLFAILLLTTVVKAQVPGSAIDVQHYTYQLQLSDANDEIKGDAAISIKFLKAVSSFKLDLVKQNAGKGMLVSSVKEDGKEVKFSQENESLIIDGAAKAASIHTINISYSGIPADGLIISANKFGHRTFFGDNWPNRAHNWLPCVDDPADKASLEFIITAPAHYQVVANGIKIDEKAIGNDLKTTHFKETAQLASKIFVIGVADFAIDNPGTPDGIPVYTYVFPENKEVGFKSYSVAKEILPFYISKFGPYAYKKLANVQSKTRYGGLENASAIFYFENSVGDKGIEELMAHEIAHQWFGDAAGEDNFCDLWLSEGFATYMTNYYLENKYGPDTLKKRMRKDRVTVLNFERRSKTPVVDTTKKNNLMALLNANSYQKGGWVLHMLRNKIGDNNFWKGIRAYYAKYNGGNAGTDDFRRVMEQASGDDLKPFFKQWLFTPGTPNLDIQWVVGEDGNSGNLTITQQQATPFVFNIDLVINGQQRSVPVSEKVTKIKTGKPGSLSVDPDVKLLGSFAVTGPPGFTYPR